MPKITINQLKSFKVLVRSEICRLNQYVTEDNLSKEELYDLISSLKEHEKLLIEIEEIEKENSHLKLV